MSTTFEAARHARYDALADKPAVSLSCGGVVARVDVIPGELCADLGCGRGADLLRLAAKAGPSGHVYGLDSAPGMVEAAQRRASESGVTNVTVRQSSLEALALPDASMDLVVSDCALNHARDKARVWREIHRVLKPGGRFVISDIYAVEPIAAAFKDDPVAVAECWAGAVTKVEYLTQVADAGFASVSVSNERAPYRKREALLSSFTLTGRK